MVPKWSLPSYTQWKHTVRFWWGKWNKEYQAARMRLVVSVVFRGLAAGDDERQKAMGISSEVCEGIKKWPGRFPLPDKLCWLALTGVHFPLIIWFAIALCSCFSFCLKPESPLLFPYYPRKSLHFVKRRMENIIDLCLQKPAVSLKEMHVLE